MDKLKSIRKMSISVLNILIQIIGLFSMVLIYTMLLIGAIPCYLGYYLAISFCALYKAWISDYKFALNQLIGQKRMISNLIIKFKVNKD